MYGYEWTDEYGIFRLTIHAKIQKEIRPVFHEELDFFGMDAYWDYPKDTSAPLLWAEGIRQYVMNGVPIAEACGGSFYTKPIIRRFSDERIQLKPVDINRLYEVNRSLMVSLEQRAIAFIRKQYENYKPLEYKFVCAFSGGKDSLALLDLMSKALRPDQFHVVFNNTGMELSATIQAVESAKRHWSHLNFIEAESHMKPTQSWDIFGPPARRMRWCCVVHKSVPTILELRKKFHDYNLNLVIFDGIRAEESARRSKYDDVSIGTKNVSQVNASPIYKWNTAELYCYLLKNSILMNSAYRLGLFRVGCMVCPLSSNWWDGIANNYYHDEMRLLLSRVEAYAQNAKLEKEVRSYIEDGGWKARMGGRSLSTGGNRVIEETRNNVLTFTIHNPTQKWLSIAPILGVVVEQSDNEGIQKIDGATYHYRLEESQELLRISYSSLSKMDRFIIGHLRGIASKCAYCVGCKACMVQCPTGAFTILPDDKILIRESLCVHCFRCLTFTEKSCLLAKSLSISGGGSNGMNMKGMNPYQHFGFRQTWLQHFMNDGLECFTKGALGNRQYDALKVWLKEAQLIVANRNHTLAITPLGEKLISFGAFNPLTWAIIWIHLAYNSVICKWFCLSAKIGESYEKADLVVMIGEQYSKSTRDNAVTALLETFRYSPVGAALKQGVPIEIKKNSYSFLRLGWEYPDAVALLYSLYLYAERTGQRKFTLTELLRRRDTPDGAGISPSDIYGLDAGKFRDAIQGLAISFPKHIRVSFIANLDNITLEEDYSSLDILDLAEED